MLISLYLVWFSLCSSLFWELRDIRSGEKFASLTLKPRSRDRILIYRYYSIQMWSLRQTLSLRNFFSEDPGHRLPARGGITSDSMLTIIITINYYFIFIETIRKRIQIFSKNKGNKDSNLMKSFFLLNKILARYLRKMAH